MRVLLLLFQSEFLLFFSSLIAVARTSKTMFNSSGEHGHPCLVLDFRGNAFNFSQLRINVCCGFLIYGFYYVEVCSFYAWFQWARVLASLFSFFCLFSISLSYPLIFIISFLMLTLSLFCSSFLTVSQFYSGTLGHWFKTFFLFLTWAFKTIHFLLAPYKWHRTNFDRLWIYYF